MGYSPWGSKESAWTYCKQQQQCHEKRNEKKKKALKANNGMKSQRTRLRATEVEKIKMDLESTNSS